jgi:aminoglycoside phosphotransferase family enzyme/predicted kinase
MPQTTESSPVISEETQGPIAAFLEKPGVLSPDTPEVRQTHVSRLFFTGTRVFKQKRALKLPFLDFTEPPARKDAAAREILLNRRTAPDIYLGVRTVTRAADGTLYLDGEGEAVDWLVEMRRFDDRRLGDRLAADGHLSLAHIKSLADQITTFHDAIETRQDMGGHAAMWTAIRDAMTALAGADDRNLASLAEELGPPLLTLCDHDRHPLDDRRAAGFVRQCHGDMHLGNICVMDGTPVPFDCIEFNDRIACVDVLYDLAFPVMDLLHFGLAPHANLLLNRYLAATRDYRGLASMPLFLAARAFVRTMVEGLSGNAKGALGYARLADRLRHPQKPCLVAVGGLSGTGKSSVAQLLAPRLSDTARTIILRSDEIRKRLFDRLPENPLPPEAYRPEASRKVFDRMMEDARLTLEAGWPVILDTTFMAPALRQRAQDLARAANVPFRGLWLDAPANTLRDRVASRTGDASDAGVEVLNRQLEVDLGDITWARIDAGGDPADVAARAADAL